MQIEIIQDMDYSQKKLETKSNLNLQFLYLRKTVI